MLKININDHPYISGMNRVADVTEISFDTNPKKIYLEMKIKHFYHDINVEKLDTLIELIAKNSVFIVVGKDDDGNDITMPDYDAIMLFIDQDMPIKTLITNIINLRDADGTINYKCGYGQIPEINN